MKRHWLRYYEKALAALNEQYEKYMGQYDVHSEDDCHLLYSAADAARNKDYESEDYRKGAERWDAENLEKLAETCDQIFWDKIPYEIAHRKQMLESILRWAEHVDEWELLCGKKNDEVANCQRIQSLR